ncbi:putative xylanase B, partial [Neocallimastix californiae]
MAFRGHALIWHAMAPGWLEREDGNTMKQSIIDHITTVLKHYEGKIDTWDVVNEAIDDSSNGNGWKLRNSFLYQKVPNFIDIAFQTARKVSPKTKLFYNDYNTEGIWAKSESVYQFVADMKRRNIPIDGVGIQYHVGINVQPQFQKINDLIGRYCKLGVEVHITELDVSCDDNCRDWDGGESKQGQVYTNALKACLGNSCCTGFLVWGIGD